MIANVFLNKKSEYKISKTFIEYLKIIEYLNYLRKANIIDDESFLRAKVHFKNLYISK